MKKSMFLVVAFLSSVSANDVVFTSLSRRATSINRSPTNVSVLTAEDIKRVGATTLAEILDLLPSVDVSRSGSLGSLSSIRMRGVPTSNQVQIIVDDQPLGGVGIQSLDLSLIPVENIEKIEVVRGGSSVLYGANTIGGIIHIKTKRQTGDEGQALIQYEGQSFQTSIYTIQGGVRSAHIDTFIHGQTYETDGYQQNSDVDHFNSSFNGGYTFLNGVRVGIDISQFDQDQGTASGTSIPFDQWDGEKEKKPNTPTNRVEKSGRQTRATLNVPVGDALIQTLGYQGIDDFALRLSPGGTPIAKFENTIIGNDTRVLFPHGFIAGASYERDERESLGQLPHHIGNWALYTQDEYDLGNFLVSPAFRFDQHSTFGNEYSPRLAIVYPVAPSVKFSALAARTYRAPTLVDLYIVSVDPFFPAFDFFGNPNLQPETGWTYDFGTEIKLGPDTKMGANGYYSRIRERIVTVDTDGNGNVDTSENGSRAELSGVELSFLTKSGPIQHSSNYTFQRAIGNSATQSQFLHLRLTPKHLLNYVATWEVFKGLNLINRIQYVARQYQLDGDRGLRIPAYTLWHARIEKDLALGSLYFQINNITDKIYTESITFGNFVPQPQRTFQIGGSIRFPAKT